MNVSNAEAERQGVTSLLLLGPSFGEDVAFALLVLGQLVSAAEGHGTIAIRAAVANHLCWLPTLTGLLSFALTSMDLPLVFLLVGL